ncbi:MAG: histidinol-phosphate aminotransferase family protein [Acidobacteria bacterium]|nr:histidinol-phosphate aminotransferase family protein [Acidobacteriota bacterium]
MSSPDVLAPARRSLPALRPPLGDVEPCVPPAGRGAFRRMDANEGPPPPAGLLAEALARAAEKLAYYPEYADLEAAAAEAWGIDPAGVVPVNGADDGIRLAVQAYCGPGAPLAVPEPAFPMYAFYAATLPAPVLRVPGRLDRPPDADRLIRVLPYAALAAVVTPGNPVGLRVPEADLERLLAAAGRRPVLADETYAAFCGQDLAPLLRRHPNLVLLRTLSKACGVPGLRCGFLLADPAVARQLRRICPPYAVSAVAAAVGTDLLRLDQDAPVRARAAATEARALSAWLADRGVETLPSDTHFFLARLGADAPGRLRAEGILVKGRGDLGPGLCRVSVAGADDAEAFREAWVRLESRPAPGGGS